MMDSNIARNKSEDGASGQYENDLAWKNLAASLYKESFQSSGTSASVINAELLNSNFGERSSSSLPDSAMAKAQILGAEAWAAIPGGVAESLLGTHEVHLSFTQGLLGKDLSIQIPNLVENTAVGAAIGFASKTLLPRVGWLGKIGHVALATYFTSPLISTGQKLLNDIRFASNADELRLAGKELGTALGVVAGSLPVVAGNFWAAADSKLLAAGRFSRFDQAKLNFYSELNRRLDSGIDLISNSLKDRISVVPKPGKVFDLGRESIFAEGPAKVINNFASERPPLSSDKFSLTESRLAELINQDGTKTNEEVLQGLYSRLVDPRNTKSRMLEKA